jgi:hypothetical protein
MLWENGCAEGNIFTRVSSTRTQLHRLEVLAECNKFGSDSLPKHCKLFFGIGAVDHGDIRDQKQTREFPFVKLDTILSHASRHDGMPSAIIYFYSCTREGFTVRNFKTGRIGTDVQDDR